MERKLGRLAMLSSSLVFISLLVITACTTPAQRRAAEREAMQKEAAREVERICALPEADRETELKKIKKESGMVLVCGK